MPRRTLTLDNDVAAELAGSQDSVLKALRDRTTSKVHLRGNMLTLEGDEKQMDEAARLVDEMVGLIEDGHEVEPATLDSVTNAIQSSRRPKEMLDDVVWHNRNTRVVPKTVNQKVYVDAIRESTITFGIGPAGTGKTFLAVAMAAAALVEGEVQRIILTRPAVEAGESLGFLPGDLQAKVDPYLRPLFDALYDMLDPDRVNGYFDRGVIEVAPLAFMRGRTLNDAFVILDEAQNTTPEQMKMFLTRLGFNSKMVVTGDVTQIDLPRDSKSGLVVVRDILEGIEDVELRDVRWRRRRPSPPGPADRRGLRRTRRTRAGTMSLDLEDVPAEFRPAVTAALKEAGVEEGHLAVEIVDEARIHELNREFRDRDKPTDVLSFPVDEDGPSAGPRELGDVVVCPEHLHRRDRSGRPRGAPPLWPRPRSRRRRDVRTSGPGHGGSRWLKRLTPSRWTLSPRRPAPASSAWPAAPTSASRPWSTRSSAPRSRSRPCGRRPPAGRSAASRPTSRRAPSS